MFKVRNSISTKTNSITMQDSQKGGSGSSTAISGMRTRCTDEASGSYSSVNGKDDFVLPKIQMRQRMTGSSLKRQNYDSMK